MKERLDDITVRLIQIRERPAIIAEEQASFRERSGLRSDQFVITNALHETLHDSLIDEVDAVLIGGAGAYSVTQTYQWTASLIRLCRLCAERELPLFGSCWGHQFIARAFGGEVVHDTLRSEIGTLPVTLTEKGLSDDLFGSLPPSFPVQMGHHDRVATLPADAIELAHSTVAPYQAFRIEGLPVYGTQFHSELDAVRMRMRLTTYRSYYPEMQDDEVFNRIYDSILPTPDADDLLRSFLERFTVEG